MTFRLLRHSAGYGLTGSLGIAASLILTPVYTRLLSKADYGVMETLTAFIALAISVLPLGLLNGVVRFYGELRDQEVERRRLMTAMLVVVSATGVAFATSLLSQRDWFISRFFETGFHNIDQIVLLACATILLRLLLAFHLELLRARLQTWGFVTANVLQFLVLTGLGFKYVYVDGENVVGFFKAAAIAALLALAVAWTFNRRELASRADVRRLPRVLAYSIHFVPVMGLFNFINVADRYIITEALSLDSLGVYAIGTRFSNVLQFGITAFGTAWMPVAFSLEGRPHSAKIFSGVCEGFVIAFGTAAAGAVLFQREILSLLAPGYGMASVFVPVLLLNSLLLNATFVFTLGIQLAKRTAELTRATLLMTPLKLCLAFLLVRHWGLLGVAVATTAALVVWLFVLHRASQRLRPIPFRYRELAGSLGVCVFGGCVGVLIDLVPLGFGPALGCKGVAALLLVGWAFFRLRVAVVPILSDLERDHWSP